MKTKKESIKDKAIEQLNDDSIVGKSIVVSNTTAPNKDEINYLIQKGGIIEQCAVIKENIHICLLGSSDINWTQKASLCNLIKDLQFQGAGIVKRLDDIEKNIFNPEFDLNHTLITYGLK